MGVHKMRTTALQALKRRQRLAEKYMNGLTQEEIAAEEGISTPRVNQLLKRLRDDWLKDSKRDFAQRRSEELAKLNRLERVALNSFIKSCLPKIEVKTPKQDPITGEDISKNPSRQLEVKAQLEAERREVLKKLVAMPLDQLVLQELAKPGDIAWLDAVFKIVQQRCRLMGFNEPEIIRMLVETAEEGGLGEGRYTREQLDKIPLEQRLRWVQDVNAGRAAPELVLVEEVPGGQKKGTHDAAEDSPPEKG